MLIFGHVIDRPSRNATTEVTFGLILLRKYARRRNSSEQNGQVSGTRAVSVTVNLTLTIHQHDKTNLQ